MAKFPKFNKAFLSENNLKKYDTVINVVLIVLSLILVAMIAKVLFHKMNTPAVVNKQVYNEERFTSCKNNMNMNRNMNKAAAMPSGNKDSSKKRMVFYYADWCGHCTNTKPEWQKLEDMYANDDSVSIEKVNEESMSNQDKSALKIEGYPTIILFVNGNAISYEGARSASNFKSFIDKN